jgi:hypothetical protein
VTRSGCVQWGALLGCAGPASAESATASDLILAAYSDGNPTDAAQREALVATLSLLDERVLGVHELYGPLDGRTVAPGLLTAEHRDRHPLPVGLVGDKYSDCAADPPNERCDVVRETDQLPVAVFGTSAHTLSNHLDIVADDHRACIEANSTKYAVKTWDNKAYFLGVTLLRGGGDERFQNADEMLEGKICSWRGQEYSRREDGDPECAAGGGA